MPKETAAFKGVRAAWDLWLEQHSVTAPAAVTEGIQKAFKEWLDDHEDQIVEAIAKKAVAH